VEGNKGRERMRREYWYGEAIRECHEAHGALGQRDETNARMWDLVNEVRRGKEGMVMVVVG